MRYKSKRTVDEKLKWVVLENGLVVNNNPSKNELNSLRTEDHKDKKYTDYELLNYLKKYFEKTGTIPVARDFKSCPGYPSFATYKVRFGNFTTALKLAGLLDISKNMTVDLFSESDILTDNNEENICKMCGNNKTSGNWHRHSKSGLYPICKHCYDIHDPNSYNNIMKVSTKSRNKELSKNSTKGKSFRTEQAILKTLGLENCNIEKNNFSYKCDGNSDDFGMIQIKSSALEFGDGFKYYEWKFDKIKLENCNTVFLVCMDKNYKNILRVYKISSEHIHIEYIRINPHTEIKWNWNDFRIDEKPYNDTYHNMSIENCSVLKDE